MRIRCDNYQCGSGESSQAAKVRSQVKPKSQQEAVAAA